jgi:OPA family glycerol-3-phosphate transporter-like MFS transporter
MSLSDPELDAVDAPPAKAADPRLERRSAITLALMVLGYTGFYFCRSNFSVSIPLITEELAKNGINPKEATLALGWVTTYGTLAYAIGKLPGGGLVDFLGGRRVYLSGMGGAVFFTVLFALGGSIPFFTLAWVGNRLMQSIGWPGMVKIVSRWFPASSYGAAMGVLSLSYLWGDSAGRYGMGLLIGWGIGWRTLYFIAAGILFSLLVLNAVFLRESPGELGLNEPPTNPANVFGKEGSDPTASTLSDLLIPLFRSPVFWMVCLLSFGLTLLRETFNTWTVKYFVEGVGLAKDRAAGMSALFPLLGGFSVLLAGYLGDRIRQGGRAAIIVGGTILVGASLFVLARIDPKTSEWVPIALVSAIGFLLIGPYSYLAGAMSLDLGGKRGGATTCGIIDFIGYLGGALAGRAMAGISVSYGWSGAFQVLAVVAWTSAVAAGVLMLIQRHRVVQADS